jgi:cytochrome c5
MRRLGCILLLVLYAAPARGQDGPSLYASHCSRCHDSGIPRAPSRRVLTAMTPERIMSALEAGSMRTQGAQRTLD